MLISVSLDFRHAPLRIRERFHLPEARVAALFEAPRTDRVKELALVSTCNRLELYAWTDATDPDGIAEASSELVRRWAGTDGEDADELGALVLRRTGEEVASHLMRVASGLESQILGDVQILGQVRRSYQEAVAAGAVGTGLHRLFSVALHAAKRVQHETGLAGGRHSVGAEAAALAARRQGPLMKRRCVVIGCGKTGERAARQLVKLGAADIVLMNRSPERAEALAKDLWGRAAPFDRLHRELARADVAIIATSADRPPVRAASLRFCRESAGTQDRPLVLIDLSVPRNVEAEVAGLPSVELLDLDALHPPLAQAEALRRAAVPQAEAIVTEELAAFMIWVRAEAAREALRPLREALDEVCRRELAYAGARAGADLDRAAERIVSKLMARPMTVLRTATARGESVVSVTDTFRALFGDQGFSVPAEVE
jgi:glutamyl-tRNA reductase